MLPAVQHITSWRKTGKYAGPATSPRTSIKSLSSLIRNSKAFKEEETYFFVNVCFGRRFPLDKCFALLPRGPSKQQIARAKYIPS